jgi:hypothetical protein
MRLLTPNFAFAVLALATTALALPHDDSDSPDMNMDMHSDMHSTMTTATATAHATDGPMSYFAYGKHSSSIIAHIALMVLGWCFVLPVGMCLIYSHKLQIASEQAS